MINIVIHIKVFYFFNRVFVNWIIGDFDEEKTKFSLYAYNDGY